MLMVERESGRPPHLGAPTHLTLHPTAQNPNPRPPASVRFAPGRRPGVDCQREAIADRSPLDSDINASIHESGSSPTTQGAHAADTSTRPLTLPRQSSRGRLGDDASHLPLASHVYPALPTDPAAIIKAPITPRPDSVFAPPAPARSRRPSLGRLCSRRDHTAAPLTSDQLDPPRSLQTPSGGILSSPFGRPAARGDDNQDLSAQRRPHRSTAGRLWNPTNSTPRASSAHSSTAPRKRRPSTPPPPTIPLTHLDPSRAVGDQPGSKRRPEPLLSLPEQWQAKHSDSTPTRPTFAIDRRAGGDKRSSLPLSVRASYDGKRSGTPSPALPDLTGLLDEEEDPQTQAPVQRKLDKGKGKAVMTAEDHSAAHGFSRDLEHGPDVMDPRLSNVSYGDGIGSAISSTDSSIMGEDVQFDGEEWGPLHPCFPHLNPHVPLDSPEHAATRIIRIRRDWLQEGDLAPTFSVLYPEILDPAGLSEQEFRRVIDKVNREVVSIFNPLGARNLVDGFLGLLTGWVWDDLGRTGIKAKLDALEDWIATWNREMEKSFGSEEGLTPPKLISLRQTGYMTLDIQISDPEITREPTSSHGTGDSRTALGFEPVPEPVSAP